jgi:3-isopropylmalate/(R)-2-methylmalate dehydratase small subunit
MKIRLEGRARRLGDSVNTDYIIASTRKRDTLDEEILKQYLLEAVDPDFAASVQPGDLLVAGRDFGCGSAMEVAATVVVAAGIRAVLAQSFSRTYYRNAVNNGLIPVVCDTRRIEEGDLLRVRVTNAQIGVVDETHGFEIRGEPLPAIMLEILAAGGLTPYFRKHGGFPSGAADAADREDAADQEDPADPEDAADQKDAADQEDVADQEDSCP